MNFKIDIEDKIGLMTGQWGKDMTNAVRKTASMCINRAAKTGRAQIAKQVRKEYTVLSSKLKEDKNIVMDKADMNKLTATLTIMGRPIPLHQFQTKGTGRSWAVKKGKKWGLKSDYIQVKVKRASGFKTLRKGFTTPKFGSLILSRVGRSRYPLKVLRGPSLQGMVKNTVVMSEIQKRIRERFESEFNQAWNKGYAIGKGRIGGE